MKFSILSVIFFNAVIKFNNFAPLAAAAQKGRNLRGFQNQRVMPGLRNGDILETMPPVVEESFEEVLETIPPVVEEAVAPELNPDDLVTTDMSSPESSFMAGDSASGLRIEDYSHICEGRKGCTCSGDGYLVYKSPRNCVKVETTSKVAITDYNLFTKATAECSDQSYKLTPIDCNFCEDKVSITGNPTQSNHFISSLLCNGADGGCDNDEVNETEWCIQLNEYNNDEFIFALNDDSKECHTRDHHSWGVGENIKGESKYDLKFQDCQGNNP